MKNLVITLILAALITACGRTEPTEPLPSPVPQSDASGWLRASTDGTYGDLPSEAPPRRLNLKARPPGDTFTNDGGAPDSFEPPSSTVIVEDSAGNSDDYTAGSVTIPFKVYRVIPNVQQAVSLGTLSPRATVTFWAYDIDTDGKPCAERNVAFLNEQRLGDLRGANDTWTRHRFSVPVSTLNFPSTFGTAAQNTFRMDIDANGCDEWLSEVDYVQIEFEAADPIVFVHGILSSAERWEELNDELASRGFVTANTVNLDYATFPADALTSRASCSQARFQSVAANVRQLRRAISDTLTGLGAERVHLVTHSKGGMDSRAFINDVMENEITSGVGILRGSVIREEVNIMSLTTLNTPHAGSPVADLGVAFTLSQNGRTVDNDLLTTLLQARGGFVRGRVVANLLSRNHVCDLTQNRARDYSRSNPVTVPVLASGTDADSDGNRTLSNADAAGFGAPGFIARGVLNQLYTFAGNTGELRYINTVPDEALPIYEVAAVDNAQFKVNDVVVPLTSASDDGTIPLAITGTGVHHNEIGVIDASFDPIINAGTSGAVDWSRRR